MRFFALKIFPCCDLFSFLHHLVKLTSDTAYANDPRIKKFAEERKQRKLQDKKAKEEAVKEKERVGIVPFSSTTF